MITGQAIKNTVMDLAPSTRTSGSNGLKASFVKGKETISFDSLLSKKAAPDTLTSKAPEQAISDTKKTAVSTTTKELSSKKASLKDSSSSTDHVKDETIKSQDTKTSNTDDSKLKTMEKTVEEVKEKVLDTLNISEEELESLMETLGLTMLDLLNPDALKQLMLDNAGTNDFMALLTDEGLSQQLTELLNQLQQVLDRNGISQQDVTNYTTNESEFHKLMDQLLVNSKNESLIDGSQDADPAKEANLESTDTADNSIDSKIGFTVERYSREDGTSQSNSSADENQSKGQQGSTSAELSNQFLDQMVNSTNATQAQFSEQVQQLSEIREIANQVLEQIKLVIKPAQTSMEFTLNPEHLGKVGLNITSKEGVITATFTTQSQIAKEAIESQLQIFKENLNNQGLKVDAIEVNVSNFGFEGSNQMDQSSSNQQEAAKGKKTVFRMNSEDADIMEEEALSGLIQGDLADQGNNFDYIA